jgi:hypothetical protein
MDRNAIERVVLILVLSLDALIVLGLLALFLHFAFETGALLVRSWGT